MRPANGSKTETLSRSQAGATAMAIASVSVKSPEKFCRHSDYRSCPMSIRARRLAVVVSWIGHPLVFVTISVGIVLATQVASRAAIDRKSTRLNSSHSQISYAVFCLKKKYHQL